MVSKEPHAPSELPMCEAPILPSPLIHPSAWKVDFCELRANGALRSSARGLLRSSLSDSLISPPLAVVVVALMRMDRFFDILNTPIAALSVVFVVVAVNVFLYFGYYSPKTPTPCLASVRLLRRRPSKGRSERGLKRGRFPRERGPQPPFRVRPPQNPALL
jgi:hypothetical protein